MVFKSSIQYIRVKNFGNGEKVIGSDGGVPGKH